MLDEYPEFVGEGQEKESCSNCRFYIMIDSGYGFCRRFPPNRVSVGRFWNRQWKIEYQVVEWCRIGCGEVLQRKETNE